MKRGAYHKPFGWREDTTPRQKKKPKSGRVCLECLCGNHAFKFYMPPNLERLDVVPTQKVQNKLYVICMI